MLIWGLWDRIYDQNLQLGLTVELSLFLSVTTPIILSCISLLTLLSSPEGKVSGGTVCGKHFCFPSTSCLVHSRHSLNKCYDIASQHRLKRRRRKLASWYHLHYLSFPKDPDKPSRFHYSAQVSEYIPKWERKEKEESNSQRYVCLSHHSANVCSFPLCTNITGLKSCGKCKPFAWICLQKKRERDREKAKHAEATDSSVGFDRMREMPLWFLLTVKQRTIQWR